MLKREHENFVLNMYFQAPGLFQRKFYDNVRKEKLYPKILVK